MKEKTCSKCRRVLSLSDFPKNKTNKDGYGYNCKKCQRQYVKIHYEENVEYYVEKSQRYKKEMHEWFNELKKTFKCNRCGENHRSCVGLYYKPNMFRLKVISRAIRSGWSQDRTLKEIDKKYEVLCANCSLKHHK